MVYNQEKIKGSRCYLHKEVCSMDIAGVSMALAQTKVQNDFGVAMLSKALDVNDEQGDAMVDMMKQSASMELSVNPNVGANFDVTV